VGADNFFLFGLTAEQVQELKSRGYRPQDYYERQAPLREVLDLIASGGLSGGDTNLFRPLGENLTWQDPFLVLADYQAYVACQDQVSQLWRDPRAWTRKSILNAARMGKFSSDRSIRDYCRLVWKVQPVSPSPSPRGPAPLLDRPDAGLKVVPDAEPKLLLVAVLQNETAAETVGVEDAGP